MSERCSQTTAKGAPCRAWPVRGSDRCQSHLGIGKRQPKLTTEVADRIAQLLRAGNYVEVAVAAVGVSRRTYYDWWQRGDPKGTDPREADCRAFRARVEQARTEGEARNVTMIASAASSNWQAAAWLLERRHPERWARASQRDKDKDESETAIPAVGPPDPFAEVDELAQRRGR